MQIEIAVLLLDEAVSVYCEQSVEITVYMLQRLETGNRNSNKILR
jgi:hypothetical protein